MAKVCASFEFLGALNDFLAPARRYHAFACVCAESASSKHMIEALGVPHTEVGVVSVNGQQSSLDYLLREGDCVVVEPLRFPVPHKASAGLHAAPRFLADAHLGGLARLLRMAGFDTVYDNAIHDDAVVQVAASEERIILTRDLELLKRRTVYAGSYIRALEPAAQMKEVVARFGLAQQARPFTLCLHCNLLLTPVDKADVLDMLPPTVRQHQAEFRRCSACRRVYWRGSHWQRMRALLQGLVAVPEDHN